MSLARGARPVWGRALTAAICSPGRGAQVGMGTSVLGRRTSARALVRLPCHGDEYRGRPGASRRPTRANLKTRPADLLRMKRRRGRALVGGEAGSRNRLWRDFSFVASSRYREKVLRSLAARPRLPSQIAEDTSLRIGHVSREFGASAVRDVLRGWGVSPDDLGADDWLSVDAYNELLELLEARFGDGSFQFIRSVSAKVVPAISTVRAEISRLVPMEVLVERAPVVYSKEWNYGRLEVRTGKHRAGFLHYEWLPTPAFCAGFHGAYEGILRSRKLSGTVTKTRCVRRGDDHCEYVMEWS